MVKHRGARLPILLGLTASAIGLLGTPAARTSDPLRGDRGAAAGGRARRRAGHARRDGRLMAAADQARAGIAAGILNTARQTGAATGRRAVRATDGRARATRARGADRAAALRRTRGLALLAAWRALPSRLRPSQTSAAERSTSSGTSSSIPLEVPEGPAVAGRRVLHRGADLVDGAAHAARRPRVPSAATTALTRARAVEQHRCPAAPARARPGCRTARAARRASTARPTAPSSGAGRVAAHAADRRLGIGRVALDADEMPVQPLAPPPRWCRCRGTGRARCRPARCWPAARGAAAPRASASDAASARAGCAAAPAPVHSGRNQSLRIWMSSFSAFIAA